MALIQRPTYMEQLSKWQDKHIVKILTGVRRCGKSTLFKMFQDELLSQGVKEKQIIKLNMEDPRNSDLLDWRKLFDFIDSKLLKGKKNYVFIDEIQMVPDFQRAADGLFINEDIDLYLTGSNSHFQSGQWATLLTGRYIEIHVLPLSFKEYVSAYPFVATKETMYQHYLETTGFPFVFNMHDDKSFDTMAIREYIQNIYNTIVLKDVVENKKIRNISRLERVLHFMGDQVGKTTSIKRISDILTSDGTKIDAHTVESYLDAFLDSYLLYKVKRYDIKGANILRTMDKYYMVDAGFLRIMLDKQPLADSGHLLENVVYLELIRRGYKVYVGKMDMYDAGTDKNVSREIDFVAVGPNGPEYYQVAETVKAPDTFEREISGLQKIRDHNPKYLLTTDATPETNHKGIQQMNVLDWLLKD